MAGLLSRDTHDMTTGGAIVPLLAVLLGWLIGLFTKSAEERWFGAKLIVDCPPDANRAENDDDLYIKVRVQNTRGRLAKSCRVYLIGLQEVMDGHVIGSPKLIDSFQLPWAGYDFEGRDVPYGVSQFVDIVRFSKHPPGKWAFTTKPPFYKSLAQLAAYRGTYRFRILVAADGPRPQAADIDVFYDGDWNQARARKVSI